VILFFFMFATVRMGFSYRINRTESRIETFAAPISIFNISCAPWIPLVAAREQLFSDLGVMNHSGLKRRIFVAPGSHGALPTALDWRGERFFGGRHGR
jgi:hypothetical protein